jgi:hypothetical protein
LKTEFYILGGQILVVLSHGCRGKGMRGKLFTATGCNKARSGTGEKVETERRDEKE